ncbi:MAG: YqgE/AlgH family protein [Acetobacter sp.]|nr:YqgE/AlgH family protein [Acetobacter sp.]
MVKTKKKTYAKSKSKQKRKKEKFFYIDDRHDGFFEYEDFDDEDFEDEDFDDEFDAAEYAALAQIDASALREIIDRVSRERRLKQSKPAPESLVGKCLVHIGDSSNALYDKAVIYITESSRDLVRGIMINKLLLGSATLECKTKGETVLKNVYEDLYQGGPENPAHGFVLFPTDENAEDDPFADIQGDIAISTSFGVLQGILDGVGPSKKIIAMGHCVWHRGELEWEIFNNQWLIIPASPKLMFDTKFEDRWEQGKKDSGVYGGRFIPHIGLA